MGGLFKTPKAPAPPQVIEPPPTPVVDDGQLSQMAADKMARRRGRAATILTDGLGSVGSANLNSKTLLGQ